MREYALKASTKFGSSTPSSCDHILVGILLLHEIVISQIQKVENLVVALVNKTSFGIKQSHIVWFLLDKDKNLLQKSHDTCRIRVVEEDTIALKTDRVETGYLPLCSNPTEFGWIQVDWNIVMEK